MAEQGNATAWAEWLQARLDERGWRQSDLVRESEGNVKRDRASKWLSGAESPTYKLAIIVANTLGVQAADALVAAGFEAASDARPEVVRPLRAATFGLRDFSDDELVDELRARLATRNVSGGTEPVDLFTVPLDATKVAASTDKTAPDATRDTK